jgi:hypothetical protein
MIDKGDPPPIQCKVSLRAPKSIRKVDGLSLIFTDILRYKSQCPKTSLNNLQRKKVGRITETAHTTYCTCATASTVAKDRILMLLMTLK